MYKQLQQQKHTYIYIYIYIYKCQPGAGSSAGMVSQEMAGAVCKKEEPMPFMPKEYRYCLFEVSSQSYHGFWDWKNKKAIFVRLVSGCWGLKVF